MIQKAILGKKIGMTQVFDETGKVVPVTVIQAGPCTVTQVKGGQVQIGFNPIDEKRAEKLMSKPALGHLKKAGAPAYRTLKEFDLEGEHELGAELTVTQFASGDRVDVTGTSKGKGYQGVIKRHGAQRTPTSHGGGPVHRHQGSMGSATDSSRVFPGKIMPGQMGGEQVTVLNLDVIKIDEENNLIAIKGAIPGPKGSLVSIRNSVKNV